MPTFFVDPSTTRRGMGQRPMLGLSRRTYPAKCSRCPHAVRPTLPAPIVPTTVHPCRRARTGHSREAQFPTKQGLPSCLINRYPSCHQNTITGTFASAHAQPGIGGGQRPGATPRERDR